MNLEELSQIAINTYNAGNLQVAENVCKEILKIQTNNATALNIIGMIRFQSGSYNEAIDFITRSLQYNPTDSYAYYNLGNAFSNVKNLDEAISCYNKALQLNPTLAYAYLNLGVALQEKGQLNKAQASYIHSLKYDPDLFQSYFNLGNIFKLIRRFDAALGMYHIVQKLNPNFVDAYIALANIFHYQGNSDKALAACKISLHLNPKNLVAHWMYCMFHLPIIYPQQANIQTYRNLYHQELINLHDILKLETPQDIKNASNAVGYRQPFFLPCQAMNDKDIQKLYGDLVHKIMILSYPNYYKNREINIRSSEEKIRVGIVSGYFYNNDIWNIMIKGLFENLDKKRFILHGYYTQGMKDHETAIAKQHCTKFISDIFSFKELCRIIYEDNLHVLIYPEIGMDSMTLRLASLRLAPVQCVSLGHPETSGLPTIDYYLSSELLEPPDGDDHYTERLIRLPNLSFYYTPTNAYQEPGLNREFLGLQPESTVFLCSQKLHKFLPRYDFLYPQIATRIGDCQFVFISSQRSDYITEQFCSRVRAAFTKSGLDADKYVTFLLSADSQKYHAVYNLADIFLDTIDWSGWGSIFNAIHHNLPLVTMPGKFMRGRFGSAVLTMMGLTETIASSLDEYIALAVRLGKDPEWRQEIKEKIATVKHRVYKDMSCISALENFLDEVTIYSKHQKNQLIKNS